MIGIRKGIQWERLTERQMGKAIREIMRTGIRIKGKIKYINVIGLYRRPGKELTMEEWRNFALPLDYGREF